MITESYQIDETKPRMKPVSEILSDLQAAIIERIGYAPNTIETTGEIIRFDTTKQGDKCGWYVAYPTPWGLSACFGNWREGFTHKWNSFEPSRLDKKQFSEFKRIQQEQAKARREEKALEQEVARKRAVALWDNSERVDLLNPYLASKRVGCYGIRQSGSQLVIPLLDLDGYLHNLQIIHQDGMKRFLSGGRKKGLFFPLSYDGSTTNNNGVIICEGYATGVSYLADYPDVSILVAFDAGNLLPVAQAFRARYPALPITILADNDRSKEINTGITKAREAATAVQAELIIPEFPDYAPTNLTDYNDWRNFWSDQQINRELVA